MFGRAMKPNLLTLALSPEELRGLCVGNRTSEEPVMGYLYTVVITGALKS